MDSLTMKAAALSEVPAGNALAVDRDEFAKIITAELKRFPNFHLREEDVGVLPSDESIVATGPLTSEGLLHGDAGHHHQCLGAPKRLRRERP